MASRGFNSAFIAAFLALSISFIGSPCSADEKADAQTIAERDFTLRVLPLLKTKCFGCHGADAEEIRGEFNMLTREGLLKGGESGDTALVPGDPAESPIYQAVLWDGLEMPPKENDRLTKSETELVRSWIAAGAPWPDAKTRDEIRQADLAVETNEDGRLVRTSGGTSDEWTNRRYQPEDLWAFGKVRSKDAVGAADLTTPQAVDHFVNRKLSEAEIKSSQTASPRTLLRRATLDLTGLPPTPKETRAFVAAWEKDANSAWSDLIDKLLASPRYGEHWGRHWLDVTRYADTGGMSNDYERSNMWRYRDYVIRSLNNDKPYNEFIVEQLAGDELADQSVMERNDGTVKDVHQAQLKGEYNEQESEWIVATGFLRLGAWDNAMTDTAVARQIYLDDLVNITGQTFLAQTLRCCKCHDHKFDPIPTRDYYRIYAAFATTHMAERKVPLLKSESRDGFEGGKAHVQKMLDYAIAKKNPIIEKREDAARAWYKEHGKEYVSHADRAKLPDEEKPPRHAGLDYVEQGQLKVHQQDEWIWNRRLERYQPMAQSVYNTERTQLAWNGARKLRIDRKPAKEKKAKKIVNNILVGGALTALGDQVAPGVLSAIALPVNVKAKDATDPYVVSNQTDGRRTALAKWIAHPNNSLTTRAIVNRIWQYHFGTGIAANANNFGGKGSKPSHPELLDWLASDFVENGWRIKRMHRAIMMSDAYRRSTTVADPAVSEKDPNNRLLSYFPRRRLSAEEIRDGMLSITGELQHSDGGVPIMPEINMEVALQPRMIQFSLAPAYQPSPEPEQRNRRTIYAYHVRGQADPFTELFNQPGPNESCEHREASAVTPQVFSLLNSELISDRSIALALRLQSEGKSKSIKAQINRAFRLVLGRSATKNERTQMAKYVADMVDYHKNNEPAKPEYPTRITRSVVEELSGKPFEYEEILPVFEDYQHDKKASDVSAETRALADMCLLLFNTNEFMYVE